MRKRSMEAVLESIHTNLFTHVEEAVASVAVSEKAWSQQEVVKRIVQYIYKAARSPALLTFRWEALAKTLVDTAMDSYGGACSDKAWFYEINLAKAFASAAWELLCIDGKPRVRFDRVKHLVEQEYEGCLDRTLLTNTMWEAASNVFQHSKVQMKIYKALNKAYHIALNDSLADSRQRKELQRLEMFIKRWVDDSMHRAWCSLEAVEDTLTERNVLKLFQALVAPFGDLHPYSCIPDCLTRHMGRPSQDWPYLGKVVKQLFETWMMERSKMESRKRRKVCSNTPAEDTKALPEPLNCFARKAPVNRVFPETPICKSEKAEPFCKREPSPADSEAEQSPADDPESSVDESDPDDSEGAQHPDCTSAEDCMGHRCDHLIRHVVDRSQHGDIYCEQCWRCFLCQNNSLQGFWQDGPLQGQPCKIQV